jgi:hydrogenase maturation protein HypF
MARTFAPPDRATVSVARHIEVRGVVQGVGFRPFVWRLAAAHGVAGWVRNDGGVVTIHAEGEPAALDRFAAAIAAQAPPLARVDDVGVRPAAVRGAAGFEVVASEDAVTGERLVSPDAATCAACLRELFDPADRRYRYPFVNCTDCGPRFTIIESLPYDRERTSMRAFPMCEDCRREYEDPADRRFHAEPVACPACGPRLRAVGFEADDVIEGAAELLRAGAIVAVKGLGGFHLACDATDEEAVARLRARKRRPDKPFAVMVPTIEQARTWLAPTRAEQEALTSWRAPIVLVADRGRLAPSVAPGQRRQGAMLPSTPLHHLLTRAAGRPLVMTSGNATDEPICVDDDEALERLAGIADAFVLHDRRIVARYDDSVVAVRTGDRAPSVWRRARSFAPHALDLACEVPKASLGTGALLHGAFCLASGRKAHLSQHVGDLDTEEALAAYRDAYDRARALFRVEPEVVAHDLHPDFMTTRFAEGLGLPRTAVQHHHAHVAATMAEHGLDGAVVGLAFDGLGLGDDGTIWGGEVLVCDAATSRRVGHLRAVRQPGGDVATAAPWRMALAHAADAGVLELALLLLDPPRQERDVVLAQLRSGFGSPLTSSAGRLFDAVAALTGICRDRVTYEGQAATWLEQAADPSAADPYPFDVTDEIVLDPRPAIAAIVEDLTRGVDPAAVAGRFHAGLAVAAAEAGERAARRHALEQVVLGGGVFHNDLLTRRLVADLERRGLRVFLPREVPVGDGGIALGQVWVAAHREVT